LFFLKIVEKDKIMFDPKEAERKAFRSTFQDGLWDIYLGMLLLLMGAGPAASAFDLDDVPLPLILGLMLVAAMISLWAFTSAKRYITTPRVSSVVYSLEQNIKIGRVRAALVFSALLGVVILVLFAFPGTRQIDVFSFLPVPLLIFGVMAIIVFGIGAYFLDTPRFYAYGFLYALPFPVALMLIHLVGMPDYTFALTYGIAALIMVGIGIVLLERFIARYPLPIIEETDVRE
jgi:hypothetical protein